MAFSDFDLRRVLDAFGLTVDRDTDLFADVAPVEPTPSARAWLDRFAPVAVGTNTESARSHFIIGPLLAEACLRSAGPANPLPGVTLDIDRERGLYGYCDFLLSRSPEFYFLRGPLVAVVEAKREDIPAGLGQCAASMVAIRLFNERDGTPQPAVYGCVTSGTVWRFLRLAGDTLTIDRPEYYLDNVGKIIGILVHVIDSGVAA